MLSYQIVNLMKKLFGKSNTPAATSSPVVAPPQPEPELIKVKEILPDDLKHRLDNGDDLVVVDMRQGWEYQSGRIPGAVHMFIQEIPHRFEELPKDKDVVFQCWHGNTSLDASAFLIQNGWDADRVLSLSGGMAGWARTNGLNSLAKD